MVICCLQAYMPFIVRGCAVMLCRQHDGTGHCWVGDVATIDMNIYRAEAARPVIIAVGDYLMDIKRRSPHMELLELRTRQPNIIRVFVHLGVAFVKAEW